MDFSVLLSVYQKEKPAYLRQALESVWQQSQKPSEIVVVEDGLLTEELYQILTEFGEGCPVFVRCPIAENVKLGRALAYGVEHCSYDLIARMDTDDLALPQRFEKQCEYMMKHPEIDVVGGWIEEFDEKTSYSAVKMMPETSEEIIKYARYRNPLNHMTVMFRKEAVLAVGNYAHFPMLEDYHLWSRMLAKGMKMYNLPEVLVRMRVDDVTYQRRGGRMYFQSYKHLRRMQREIGILSISEYCKAILLTWGITSPFVNRIRKFLYRKVLRR